MSCGRSATSGASPWSRTPPTRTGRPSTAASRVRSGQRRRSRSTPPRSSPAARAGWCSPSRRRSRRRRGSTVTRARVPSAPTTRLGSAWRMSELHAATGLVHLRRMEEFIARRRTVAARYDKALADLDGLQPLAEPPGCRSNIYKYIALLPAGLDRARFKSELAQRFQVKLSGEVYDLPLHRQPVLAEYAGPPLPVAEELAARHICLPVHSDMTDGEVDEVLAAVAAVHGAFA